VLVRSYTKLAALCGFTTALSDGETEEVEWFGDDFDVLAAALGHYQSALPPSLVPLKCQWGRTTEGINWLGASHIPETPMHADRPTDRPG
jgi:hypothetical protein